MQTQRLTSVIWLSILAGCAHYGPAREQPITQIPPVASAPPPWGDQAIYVEAAAVSSEMKASLERTLLRSGYRVTEVAAGAPIVIILGDAGGAFAEDGVQGTWNQRGFDVLQWAVATTVTYQGRQVMEAAERAFFAIRRQAGESLASYSARLSMQTVALANLIAARITNGITARLAAMHAPEPATPAVRSAGAEEPPASSEPEAEVSSPPTPAQAGGESAAAVAP